MSWFETARTGAAREFGRRHWRVFAAAEVARWVTRRVVPTMLILTAVLMAVGLMLRYSAWILPRLVALAVASAALGVALWAWQWWRRSYRPGRRAVAAATMLASIGVLGISVYWLR